LLMEKKGKNGSLSSSTVVLWIIGLFVLVLICALFFILKDKSINILGFVKNLFKYGR